MIVLLLAVVVVVAIGLLVVAAAASSRLTTAAVIGGAAVAVAAMLVVPALFMVGLRTGVGEDASPADDVAERPDPSVASTVVKPAAPATDQPDVVLRAGAAEFSPPQELANVEPEAALVIRAEGFLSFAGGTIAWCDPNGCYDAFPVQVAGNGSALLQYELPAAVRRCGRSARCWLRVEVDEAIGLAVLSTAPPDATRATVRTASDSTGSRRIVTLDVDGASLDDVDVLACSADAERRADCSPARVDGRRVDAGRDVDRLVFIDARTGIPLAPPAVVAFRTSGPRYDPPRLVVASAIGFLLCALALVVVRVTDWREPASLALPDEA